MIYKHPCKECLIRPLCKNKCNLLNDYINKIKLILLYFHIFLISSISISYIIMLIIIMVFDNPFPTACFFLFITSFISMFLYCEVDFERIVYFNLKDIKERHSYDI